MRSRAGGTPRIPLSGRVGAVLAVMTFALIAAVPQASAQDVEIDIAIVFEGQDQTCMDGSDKLISAAFPFDVEACFAQGGQAASGR